MNGEDDRNFVWVRIPLASELKTILEENHENYKTYDSMASQSDRDPGYRGPRILYRILDECECFVHRVQRRGASDMACKE